MITIRSFKTSDGRIFEKKVDAETHEVMMRFRGIIQTRLTGKGIGVAQPQLTPTSMAEMLANDDGEFYNQLLTLRRKKAAEKAATKINLVKQ